MQMCRGNHRKNLRVLAVRPRFDCWRTSLTLFCGVCSLWDLEIQFIVTCLCTSHDHTHWLLDVVVISHTDIELASVQPWVSDIWCVLFWLVRNLRFKKNVIFRKLWQNHIFSTHIFVFVELFKIWVLLFEIAPRYVILLCLLKFGRNLSLPLLLWSTTIIQWTL